MKKKGFTLIELLAVLTLLGLILGLVFPNIVDQVQKKRKEIDDSKLNLIYSGAKKYCKENNKSFPCTTKLSTLYNENQIPFEITDYFNEGNYGNYTCITVDKQVNGKYSYKHSKTGC